MPWAWGYSADQGPLPTRGSSGSIYAMPRAGSTHETSLSIVFSFTNLCQAPGVAAG